MSKQQQWMRNRPDGPLHKADISCESNGCWPVAVIDVEDREQVERLAKACPDDWCFEQDAMTLREVVGQLQAALREFADPKPPKPEEPTGLGAVVEDANQVEFIHLGSGLWAYGTTDGPSLGFAYADIDVVRVLSEGVPAGEQS